MAQIKVDGELIEVPDHFTLMQAAEAAIFVPVPMAKRPKCSPTRRWSRRPAKA
jgi:hypothetical protein